MIQRVQSVYLLLVTVLMSLFLVNPYAEITLAGNEVVQYFSFAIHKYLDGEKTELILRTLPLLILVLVTGAVSFLNIFLYSKRVVQMRICALTVILLILQLGLEYYYYASRKNDFDSFDTSFNLVAIAPVLSLILVIMAYRAIHRDETLVKSYDRIR